LSGYAMGVDYLNDKSFSGSYRIEIFKKNLLLDSKIVNTTVATGSVDFDFSVPETGTHYMVITRVTPTTLPNSLSYIEGNGTITQ